MLLVRSFLSVVVITCASHAQGRRFEPGRKQCFFFFHPLLCDTPLAEVQARISSFLSVAVITCASHAQGRRFEPGRKHPYFASSTTKARLAEAGDTR